jgi:hypothetical protein
MTNQPGSGFEDFGRKVDETLNKAVPRAEEELKRVIAYLNDEVVPSVRENSSKALRVASEQLIKLAELIDRHTIVPGPGPGSSSGPGGGTGQDK